MVKLVWVTENRKAIHFECIGVNLSVGFVAGDYVSRWSWIIFYIQGI